jgi:endoglucanase
LKVFTRSAAALLFASLLQACSTAPVQGVVAPPRSASADRPAIQVNQVGFLPGAAKWAAVPASATANAGTSFSIVDARSSQEVYRGTLRSATDWEPAQEAVRLADFSAFTTPGEYRLRVEGVADSVRLRISPNAYAALNAAAIKAYYYNRASIELKPKYAHIWARPAGHPDEHVLVHASAAGPGRPEGSVISAPKGWYDAGDYNKYIVNSGITVYTLLAAYEHFPAVFQKQNLNIPESGNGLPDLLNEALWNLDWMLAMQDPVDGGVYHKLTNKGFDAVVMPHQATSARYVVQKTTAATLDFAAVMAQASRVFAPFEAQRPGLSARMLAASKAAWTWAAAHPATPYHQPADIHTGGYDDDKFDDEFKWAAAELYVSTRDDSFLKAMLSRQVKVDLPGWGSVGTLGWITLAQHRDHLTPAADRAAITQSLLPLAQELTERWQASAYRVSMGKDDFYWGSNAVALNQALVLIQGYRLSGERRMLDAAQAAFDFVLGRHPTGYSMVTGFGERSPLHPHHRPSGAQPELPPVPGFIVGGPRREGSDDCATPYPAGAAKAWQDHMCSFTTNEVAINWNAPLVYLSAALQTLTPKAAP